MARRNAGKKIGARALRSSRAPRLSFSQIETRFNKQPGIKNVNRRIVELAKFLDVRSKAKSGGVPLSEFMKAYRELIELSIYRRRHLLAFAAVNSAPQKVLSKIEKEIGRGIEEMEFIKESPKDKRLGIIMSALEEEQW